MRFFEHHALGSLICSDRGASEGLLSEIFSTEIPSRAGVKNISVVVYYDVLGLRVGSFFIIAGCVAFRLYVGTYLPFE